jgi:RNA polymerase sigma-70 factor, ECF subfamily
MGASVGILSLGALMAAKSQPDGRAAADLAMERYADGDDDAFLAVYQALEPRLMRFALHETRSRAAAEDVVQQALLQVIDARARFVRGAPVLPWAYAIARRLLIDRHRHGARERPLPDGARPGLEGLPEPAATGPSPEEALDDRRREAALREDLARLPSAHREAFQLTSLEGLSVAAAAEALGITPGMVKIRSHRAREALRQADAGRRRTT